MAEDGISQIETTVRILYLTWDDVSRPTCGCAVRSAFLYKALKMLGDVDVVQLKHEIVHESLLAILFRKLTKVARWPLGKPIIDLSAVHLHFSPSPQKYDAVVCRYLMTAAITQVWKIAPCYVDIDDLPSEAFASVEGKRLPRFLRPLGAFLVNHWQRYCLSKCSGAWVVSESDKSAISHFSFLASHFPISILPNLARRPGPDYRVDAPQERLLMTVGLMGYDPNREGVEWFLTTIWPKVHERWSDMTYAIAGGGLPEDIKAKWMQIPGVQVLGFVDDLDALYAKSLAVVTPILSGAGTCIKVAEAGLHGRIVLATPKAARGQDTLTVFGDIMLFETADQICEALKRLMDDEYRKQMQRRLATEAEQVNSLEKFEKEVKHVLISSREEP